MKTFLKILAGVAGSIVLYYINERLDEISFKKKEHVILVKVEPYGVAEKELMGDWEYITKFHKMSKCEMQLAYIFDTEYNQYVLHFSNFKDLTRCCAYLTDYLYKITKRDDYEDSFTPCVCEAVERPIK